MLVNVLRKALILPICIEAVLALGVRDASTSRVYHCHKQKFRRRDIVASLASLLTATLPVQQSLAADAFDDTQAPLSGLSQQIRRSAVRGAQVIDKIDGKWERFSDDFGLGENRNKPKVDKLNKVVSGGSSNTASEDNIPANFNEELANTLLNECDLAFLKSFNAQKPRKIVTSKDLINRVDDVKRLVRRSFFPSLNYQPTPQNEFNYEMYSHFKAFNDILIENKVTFPRFYAEFEEDIGTRMVEKIPSVQSSLAVYSSSTVVEDQVQNAFKAADMTGTILSSNGFISSWERTVNSKEDIEDFIEPYTAPSGDNFSVASDLKFTLALMGDVTLNSQLLLQELGYRLYPSLGRWILRQSLLACFPGIDNNRKGGVAVNIDDYFMDTAYNSNPDLFQVRQILMNVVLQRN